MRAFEVTCTKTWIKLGNFTSLNDYFRLSYLMINYQYHKNTFLGLRRYKAYLWSSDRPAFWGKRTTSVIDCKLVTCPYLWRQKTGSLKTGNKNALRGTHVLKSFFEPGSKSVTSLSVTQKTLTVIFLVKEVVTLWKIFFLLTQTENKASPNPPDYIRRFSYPNGGFTTHQIESAAWIW